MTSGAARVNSPERIPSGTGEDSASGICIAPSATCSHGIGDGNPEETPVDAASTDSGSVPASPAAVDTGSNGTGGAEPPTSASSDCALVSRDETEACAEGESGSGITIEESATCSHGMGEGTAFSNSVSGTEGADVSSPFCVSRTSRSLAGGNVLRSIRDGFADSAGSGIAGVSNAVPAGWSSATVTSI